MSGYECVIVQGVMGIFNLSRESSYRDALFSAEINVLKQFNILVYMPSCRETAWCELQAFEHQPFHLPYCLIPSYHEHVPDAIASCSRGSSIVGLQLAQSKLHANH